MNHATLKVGSLACMMLGATISLFALCSAVNAQSTTAATCADCQCYLNDDAGLYCRLTGATYRKCNATNCKNCVRDDPECHAK
jgi:hypothetical protein